MERITKLKHVFDLVVDKTRSQKTLNNLKDSLRSLLKKNKIDDEEIESIDVGVMSYSEFCDGDMDLEFDGYFSNGTYHVSIKFKKITD